MAFLDVPTVCVWQYSMDLQCVEDMGAAKRPTVHRLSFITKHFIIQPPMSRVLRFRNLFLEIIFFKVALIILSNYKDIHIHCRTFDEKQSKKPKQEMKITHNPTPRDNLC